VARRFGFPQGCLGSFTILVIPRRSWPCTHGAGERGIRCLEPFRERDAGLRLLRLAPDGVSQSAVKRLFGGLVLLLGNLPLLVLDFQLEELFL